MEGMAGIGTGQAGMEQESRENPAVGLPMSSESYQPRAGPAAGACLLIFATELL